MENLEFFASFINEGIYIVDLQKTPTESLKVEEPKVVYETPKVEKAQNETDTPFLGVDSEKLAVVVNYENTDWIPLKDKLVLEKILAAINLNIKSIALINLANTSITGYKDLLNSLKANNLIFFGTENAFNEGSKKDEVIAYNSRKLLFTTDNITRIAMSKELKKVLWKNLKLMFLD
jgi:hypothetical protein